MFERVCARLRLSAAAPLAQGLSTVRFASAGFAVVLLAGLTALVFRQQLFGHWTFPWDFLGAYTTTPAYVAAAVGGGSPSSRL